MKSTVTLRRGRIRHFGATVESIINYYPAAVEGDPENFPR